MPFPADVRKNYVNSGGMFCPKCGSGEFETKGQPRMKSPTEMTLTIRCANKQCSAEWDEVFTLSDIRER